jgi:cellulose synthase/poly-beta-1,6-N-acetylglucosamine synthase-like glycosyltransferase
MSDTPLVTVVIPVLDGEADLGRLLQALHVQAFPRSHYEILVVDNGSTDRSIEIARARGVSVLTEPHRSSYRARNRGIAQARGEIIAFTDVDCVPDSHWLQELVAPFGEPCVGGVAGTLLHPWGQTLAEAYCAFHRTPNHCSRANHGRLAHAVTANVAYRRSVFEHLGSFDEHFLSQGDVDFSWRLQQQGRWQLRFLEGRAQVVHRAPKHLQTLVRKFERYGRGMADLQSKYPQHPLVANPEAILAQLQRPAEMGRLMRVALECAHARWHKETGWQSKGFPLVASLLQRAFYRGFLQKRAADMVRRN